jgi:hypothetical protein
MKIGDSYTLSKIEERLAKHVGLVRHETNERAGVKEKKHSDRDPLEIHQEGAGGELAMYAMLGVYPSRFLRSTELRCARTDSGDIQLSDGKWLDVKTRPKQPPYTSGLMTPEHKSESSADYYALFIVEWPIFVYRGALPKEELIRPERIKNFGKGPTYYAEDYELLDLTFVAWPAPGQLVRARHRADTTPCRQD